MGSLRNIYRFIGMHLVLACFFILCTGVVVCPAADLGTPVLSSPLQQEKFFETERLTAKGESSSTTGGWEPQVGLSHVAREDEAVTGERQTTHKIHGEAGGKLNLLNNVSLTAIARIPLYTHEARFGESAGAEESKVSTDLLGKAGKLSWRSEVGVNLGSGVDLNLFYDRSMFGKVDRPGLDDQEEKFGSRIIIHFK